MNPTEWARCRDWIVPALRHDTIEHVEDELTAGRAQLWGGERGAIITQLVRGVEPLLMVWLAGGSLQTLLALQPGVEAWGRAHGCAAVWINGRKGWARVLKHSGFVWVGEELRKALK